jgi:anti-anti-sigma factor
VVLLLVFGTLTGAAIPILMALISIIVALGITAVVGQIFQLNLFITNMVVAMGLALGIDYSLFIVSRLREERHRGSTTREAILIVAGTATRAVVFSGTAFTLAMIGMLLVPDTVVDGSPNAAGTQQGLPRLRAELARDRDFAEKAVTLETGPRITLVSVPLTVEASSERASKAIDRLRDDYVPRAFGAQANRVLVGGGPAEARDSFAVSGSWLPIVIAFVLILSLVLLTLAFRSIVIPLTAIAVNLLSVGAAYGILVLVFQNGVGNELLGFDKVQRIESWVPIFLFSVLFGLSMDYQVFLLSRIHERWAATGDTRDAIVHGVASTARLITGAAAIIIIVVFAGFATGQLVSFQQMGFGIAIALAIDATLVRLILIPAAMRLLGERNWYLPRWLDWLPDLQVEGAPAAAHETAKAAEERTSVSAPAGTAAVPADDVSDRLEIHVHPRVDGLDVNLEGELTLVTASLLAAELERVEAARPRLLVIDLRELRFMDSSGLGELVKANHRARRENRRLVLIKGEGSIARILAVAGVEDTIETEPAPQQ